MKPFILAVAALTIGSVSPGIAADAPFGSDARAPGIC